MRLFWTLSVATSIIFGLQQAETISPEWNVIYQNDLTNENLPQHVTNYNNLWDKLGKGYLVIREPLVAPPLADDNEDENEEVEPKKRDQDEFRLRKREANMQDEFRLKRFGHDEDGFRLRKRQRILHPKIVFTKKGYSTDSEDGFRLKKWLEILKRNEDGFRLKKWRSDGLRKKNNQVDNPDGFRLKKWDGISNIGDDTDEGFRLKRQQIFPFGLTPVSKRDVGEEFRLKRLEENVDGFRL